MASIRITQENIDALAGHLRTAILTPEFVQQLRSVLVPPEIRVHLPPPIINLLFPAKQDKKIEFKRDGNGEISSAEISSAPPAQ